MSFNVDFKVKDGKIDPESVKVSGTPPAGEIKVWGHTDEFHAQVGVTVGELMANASRNLKASPGV